MNANIGGPANPGNDSMHLLASSNNAANALSFVRRKYIITKIITYYRCKINILLTNITLKVKLFNSKKC